jgi:hypothetical protein
MPTLIANITVQRPAFRGGRSTGPAVPPERAHGNVKADMAHRAERDTGLFMDTRRFLFRCNSRCASPMGLGHGIVSSEWLGRSCESAYGSQFVRGLSVPREKAPPSDRDATRTCRRVCGAARLSWEPGGASSPSTGCAPLIEGRLYARTPNVLARAATAPDDRPTRSGNSRCGRFRSSRESADGGGASAMVAADMPRKSPSSMTRATVLALRRTTARCGGSAASSRPGKRGSLSW